MIYQFTHHKNLPKNSPMPDHPMFRLYRRLRSGEELNREEKDKLFDRLYGIFGSQSSTFKFRGFAAPFHQVLNLYLVKLRHYGWKEYYSADKTAIRKTLGSYDILAPIVEIDNPHKNMDIIQ